MHWIDPHSLPLVNGSVSRFLFNPDGLCDGFLFDDGLQVHFPPHLSRQLLKRVKEGDRVGVHGLKPRGAEVLAALSVTTHGGHCIEDLGPHAQAHHSAPRGVSKSRPVQLDGTVARRLYAPKGEVSGALLEDGTAVRMHPRDNEALLPLLLPGRRITVWGDAIGVHGHKVIDISHLAPAD
jgi:hypothetical protein